MGIKDELFLENLKKDEPFPENLKKAIMLARKSNELILSQEDQKKLVTVVDCFGNSVLFHAALNNDCKTAGYLMELGACPFYYKGVGMEPIEVVRKLNNKNMQELLLNSKYPANQGSHNNTCSGLHKVLDKKYSMDSMLDARKLGPISGSNAFPGLQGLQEYVSSSTTYPVREYPSNTSCNNSCRKQKQHTYASEASISFPRGRYTSTSVSFDVSNYNKCSTGFDNFSTLRGQALKVDDL